MRITILTQQKNELPLPIHRIPLSSVINRIHRMVQDLCQDPLL